MLISANGASQNPCHWALQRRSQCCNPNHSSPGPTHDHSHSQWLGTNKKDIDGVQAKVLSRPKGFKSPKQVCFIYPGLYTFWKPRFKDYKKISDPQLLQAMIREINQDESRQKKTKQNRVLWLDPSMGPKAFAPEWVKCSGGGEVSGLLDMGAPRTVVPTSTGEALGWTTIRLREYKGCSPNKSIDRIMNISMFKQVYANSLCHIYLNVCMGWIFYMGTKCLPYQVL